ncbi:MAG: AAA family ATPase, partial [Thermogutta sp.]
MAFERDAELLDHEGTNRIVEILTAEGKPEAAEGIERLRNQRLTECRDALRRDVAETQQAVEDAVAFGLLGEEERSSLADTVDVVEMNIETALTFDDWHRQLREVRDQIQSRREAGIEEVRRRMHESRIDTGHPAYRRIAQALENRDVLTANEYIDMAVRGDRLPEPREARDTLNEFLGIYPTLEGHIERVSDHRIVNDVRECRSIGPVSLRRVPGAQAQQAADMLDAWFTAKRLKRMDKDGAAKVLLGLGLTVLSVEVEQAGGRTWLEVRTDAIRDRELCPVPAYGSLAHGRYKVLCVWDRPAEEDLVSAVGTGPYGTPVVVFHFGRLTQQRRRDLARLCRERQRGFIVVDDMLLIYLCGERGSRLPVLFDCALPFTFQTPYTTTAGLVPPEMFYGRQLDRESIIDPLGTCFIYGGRQLGKTALLRQVEREFHDPERGRLALWLDLKAEGIGSGRIIDDVWSLLAGRLKDFGVLPSQLPAHVSPGRMLEQIEEWLKADDRRRILLLLDEADRFLESDGEEASPHPFSRVEMLKGLMDRTDRHFKVVFAGLHDVQRTSRQVNQPLAPGHCGDPLCIGPLINNGEWREARALIERPLAAIGYRFESPDLVTRILSQTNYYPSLIQLYCSHLLKHLQGPHAVAFDSRCSPPYVITSRHVEEAYHSQELRRAVRDRFDLTLNLDRRYRVFALTVALYSQPGEGARSANGFTAAWVREQALTFWPRGFRTSTSEAAFQVLLDEMVGLGVLRKVTETSYALRSPNVASLIGTVETIQRELESCESWPDPAEYNPATFRAAIHDEKGKLDL